MVKTKWEVEIEKENRKDNPILQKLSAEHLEQIFEDEWKKSSWMIKLWINKDSAKLWYLNGARNGMQQLIEVAKTDD